MAEQGIVTVPAAQDIGPDIAGQYVVLIRADEVDDIRHIYRDPVVVFIQVCRGDLFPERIALGVVENIRAALQA